MSVPGWLRPILLLVFATALAWGAYELAKAIGWWPGGDLTLYRIELDLLRAVLGAAAAFLGFCGFYATIRPLFRRVRGPARMIGEPLQTERESDGRRLLTRDLELEVDGLRVKVPQGTRTDYSSIPSFGRVLVRWSRVDVAGVVHDWMYDMGSPSRAKADRIWRLVALSGDHRANIIQAWVAWTALRLFGWIAWCNHRRRDR